MLLRCISKLFLKTWKRKRNFPNVHHVLKAEINISVRRAHIVAGNTRSKEKTSGQHRFFIGKRKLMGTHGNSFKYIVTTNRDDSNTVSPGSNFDPREICRARN